MFKMPESINKFNVYNGTNRLIGVTGAVEMPSFAAMTNTIAGAGIAGEYEAPVDGHFGSQQIKIPYAQIDEQEFFDIVKGKGAIVLRGAIQVRNVETDQVDKVAMVVTVRGPVKEFDMGSVEKAKAMSASVTKEVTYIKIVINNVVCLELDKFNNIYIINGEDQLAKVRAMI